MNSILLAKNIDVSKVTFSDNVKTLDNGGKTVYIGYNGQPLYVQTPEMVTPFDSSCWNATGGTDPSKDKHSVELSFKGMDGRSTLRHFHNFLNDFDTKIVESALENCTNWLKKKYNSTDVIAALYTPLLKRSKNKDTGEVDDKYPPTFKVNLPFVDNKYKVDIYNADREIVPMSSIQKGSKVTAILQCTGVWIAGGKFGCSWRAIQLRVITPQVLTGYGFRDDEDATDDMHDSHDENDHENHKDCDDFERDTSSIEEVQHTTNTSVVESSSDDEDPIERPASKKAPVKKTKK